MARCMWHSVRSKPISVCIQIMYVYVSLIYHMPKQQQSFLIAGHAIAVHLDRRMGLDEVKTYAQILFPSNWQIELPFLIPPIDAISSEWFVKMLDYSISCGSLHQAWNILLMVFWNSAVTSRYGKYPIIDRVQKHPKWWAGFLSHQQYDLTE